MTETHILSVTWWVSRMEGNLLNETKPQNKTHFFVRSVCALSAKRRICNIFLHPGPLLSAKSYYTHQDHTQAHLSRGTVTTVCHLLHFSPARFFYGCLRAVPRGTRRFNSLRFKETHNKEGAWGVRQSVEQFDINTHSAPDLWGINHKK